jgi:uncharacterized protein YhaN
MADADDVRNAAQLSSRHANAAKLAQDMKRRREELIVFREAGVLTQSELEEHMVRLRWGLS